MADEPIRYWLSKGTGYYDTTKYPLGGCFRRHIEANPLCVNVLRRFERTHGCDVEGVTDDGIRVCIDSNLAHTSLTQSP